MLVHYFAPFMMAFLAAVLAIIGTALRRDRFLYWIACGYLLTGVSLGVQSFFSNSDLALAAPLTTVLYLAGAAAITQGAALRCGDGWRRKAAVWAISAICVVNAARLAYVDDNLPLRMISLNVTLGLIYLSQLPYMIRDWKTLPQLDRLIGFTVVQLALFHLLRAGYVWQHIRVSDDPMALLQNLTQSAHWQILLACSMILSIWFGCLALICATKDRYGPRLIRP